MYARQRINKMQAGRQRFVAHLAEKIDDPNMSGRDHASRANQHKQENNEDNENESGRRFHEA